jgi:glucose/arabinose dehydrogenase
MTDPTRVAGARRPGGARRRSARAPLVVAGAAITALVLLTACGSSADDATTHGSVPGTAPLIESAGGDYSSTGATLPAPIAVPTLDGIALKLDHIGDVHEPVALISRSGTDTLYVAQKDGRIKTINVQKQLDKDGKVTKATYQVNGGTLLDISRSTNDSGERGMLGLAFSSDGRKMYVDYTDRNGAVTVDEYRMNDDQVDVRSQRNLLRLDHPEPNHNGGQIVFGPDGFLYVGVGDGGGQGDPNKNGQNVHTLYGKILRIDPEGQNGSSPYAAPAGNPFQNGQAGAPEVWTFGLRNPWRFSFDKVTKDLWIGDVGQDTNEEIDFLPAVQGGAGRGANLGWSLMEGSQPYNGGSPPAGYTPPIFDYSHANGSCSVTGGYVYRGKAMFSLLGVYLYADYCNGEIRMLLRKPDNKLDERGTGLTVPKGNLESNGSITSFGQDNDGELYVLSAAGGIYKIEPAKP